MKSFAKRFPVLCRIHFRQNGSADPKKGLVVGHTIRDGLPPFARILLDGASRVVIAWEPELKRLVKKRVDSRPG